MRKFLRNCKGAVTVFVSLLLIPAILVSGTAVDITRIYATQSLVHNANQLAANAILTEYNALLQDLYGLYGVMADDEELADMIDEYIKITVFGRDEKDRTLGTFQQFYGDANYDVTVTGAPGKNLRNAAVLRRQIEEYAKLRAPIVLVQGLLDALGDFDKAKKDAEVIEKKMAVDEKIEDIDKIYRELYGRIQDLDAYKTVEKAAFDGIDGYMTQIRSELIQLEYARMDWDDAREAGETDEMRAQQERFKGIRDNIKALIHGGRLGRDWIMGGPNAIGGWQEGRWDSGTRSHRQDGLVKFSADAKESLSAFLELHDTFVTRARQADTEKKKLLQLIDELEAELDKGECTEAMQNGMTAAAPGGKSTMQTYRELVDYEIEAMAEAMRTANKPRIEAAVSMIEAMDSFGQRGQTLESGLRAKLTDLENTKTELGLSLELNQINESRREANQPAYPDNLAKLTAISADLVKVERPPSDKKYDAFSEVNQDCKTFYELLDSLYRDNSDNKKKKDNAKGFLKELVKSVKKMFQNVVLDPQGAEYYRAEDQNPHAGSGTNFGQDDSDDDPAGMAKKAIKDDLLSKLSNAGDGVVDKVVLMTYCTGMFSNYASELDAASQGKTMNGIPINLDVNYFFESEQEFLYNGSEGNARANLRSVSSMMLLVRFVCNYVSTFALSSVQADLNAIMSACAFAGPFAIVIRELARVAFALAESAIDVATLRDGKRVPLVKMANEDWAFSMQGIAQTMLDGAGDQAKTAISNALASSSGAASANAGGEKDRGSGLSYSDYMFLFMLFVEGDVLAQRAARLIELNVTNYKNNIGRFAPDSGEREPAMAALELFQLSKARTDFKISTEIEMRMLFLSMPLAQRGMGDAVAPPRTFSLSVSDYRGY